MTTTRPWPEGTRPTPAQLLAYLHDPASDTDDEALAILLALLEAADDADRCRIADHAGTLSELTRAQLDAARWRVLRDLVLDPDTSTSNADIARRVAELAGEDRRP